MTHIEVSDEEPEAPEEAPPSSDYVPGPEHPPSPDYVPGPEHPPSPDYVPGLEEPEQAPLSPNYVHEPEYPEYLVPSDAEVPIEDQPDDASPTALLSGYVADSDPEEDLEEDLEEDPVDYPADGGDDDDESFMDDADAEDEEEASKEEEDDKEEEEHLALADSSVVPAVDPIPLAEDTEAFEIDKSAPTPPSPRPHRARISVRLLSPMEASMEARIPSPPLPLPSPPTQTSRTYAEALLGYKAAMIRSRVASASTHHPLEIPSPPLLLPSTTHRDDLPEADMPLQKRACFTAPTSRFEVWESSSATAARHAGHALAHRVDYGFVDTVDASIRASESRATTVVGEVNDRVTDLAATQRQDAQELYVRYKDAHDDRAFLRAHVSLLTKERRYFCSMASSYEREAVISRQPWAYSKNRSHAIEAHIRALQRDVNVLQRQRIKDEDRLTNHIQYKHDRFKELVRTTEAGPRDGPADAGSSC
ncbi:hypothetical protein Tco_0655759 [Tanacetum coccineum]|uniref:Uncharacterized protein n=1 Tax=Tanacetum coccineum TaxID=301880 RepID=A0ABQ4X6V7_9ASTR